MSDSTTEMTDTKRRFVTEALREAQAGIRNLETRAGFLVVFETALIVIVLSGLAGSDLLALIRRLLEQGMVWFAALLMASFVLLAVALIIHLILTLRVLLPIPNPGAKIILAEHEPQELFYPRRLDASGRLRLSVDAYVAQLAGMSDAQVVSELIYEQLRLSYVRAVKQERLHASILYLGALAIGMVFFGFLLALGGILY